MKIKKVEAKLVSIPLEEPKYFSNVTIKSRKYLITKISTDAGITGWGITFYVGRDTKLIVENMLQPLLIDEDPNYVEDLWQKMFNKTFRAGRRGVYLRAISAVDIALWDIKCKTCNMPLYKLLGGYKKSIPVYITGGYYSLKGDMNEVEAITKEMEENVKQGFLGAKIKVGAVDISIDLDRMKAARKVLGNDRKLYIDVNNGWKLHQMTPKLINTLEEIGLDWIEEPFMPDTIEETIKFKEKTNIPIAGGEVLATRWDFKQLLESDSVDIWQPDVSVLGGITEWNKVMNMALLWDIPVAPHAVHEIHAHLAAACPGNQIYTLEYFDTTGDTFNYGKLLKKPLKAKDGYLQLSDEPGVGVEFNEELVENYEVKNI